jgi:SAM-dependent methyltransferase
MSENRSKQYYDGIFFSDADRHWEKAPGKDVILGAIQHYCANNTIPNNAKVVDIGCGSGFFLNKLHSEVLNNNFQLYGVDFSSTAINKAKKLYQHIKFYCEDGGATHFDNDEFAVLVSYGTYEHFRNPEIGIKELTRILKPGGLFFLMMPTLGIDRTDRDDEGWYEEREVQGSPIKQMQWNLKRHTWEQYFFKYDLMLFPFNEATSFGAKKPGVFFFGKKPEINHDQIH